MNNEKRTRAFRWTGRERSHFYKFVILFKDGGERKIYFDGGTVNNKFQSKWADWFLAERDFGEEVPEAELALLI